MINLAKLPPKILPVINGLVIFTSVMICLILMPLRIPGMELLQISPDWLLIWVVTWSVKRTVFQAMLAGLVLGAIQDGMTSYFPTHIISLVIVGVLTSRIQKQRYIEEDFISVALIVFIMAILAETVMAIQYIFQGIRPLDDIWNTYQKLALASAIITSLWTPVFYYPLNRWWQYLKTVEVSSSYFPFKKF